MNRRLLLFGILAWVGWIVTVLSDLPPRHPPAPHELCTHSNRGTCLCDGPESTAP